MFRLEIFGLVVGTLGFVLILVIGIFGLEILGLVIGIFGLEILGLVVGIFGFVFGLDDIIVIGIDDFGLVIGNGGGARGEL